MPLDNRKGQASVACCTAPAVGNLGPVAPRCTSEAPIGEGLPGTVVGFLPIIVVPEAARRGSRRIPRCLDLTLIDRVRYG